MDYCQLHEQSASTVAREAITHYLNIEEDKTVSQTERALEQRSILSSSLVIILIQDKFTTEKSKGKN
jgi:hypothetical protein